MPDIDTSPRGRALGVFAILLPYALAFGVPAYWGIRLLLAPWSAPEAGGLSAELSAIGISAVGFVVAIALTRGIGGVSFRELGFGLGQRRTIWGVAGAVALAYLGMRVAFEVLGLLPAPAGASGSGPATVGAVDVFARAVRAGFFEEVLLLAMPIGIMRRMGWSWQAQIGMLVGARLVFHLYYGPGAIALAIVWMVAFWWLYQRIGSVWPFVVAHVAYDCVVSAGAFGPVGRVGLVGVSLALIVASVVAFVSGRYWRRAAAESLTDRRAR